MPELKQKKMSNDQIVLETLLKRQQAERDPDSSILEFFEYFCADNLLKEFDLSDEELESGLVSDDNAGGINAFYTLVNNKLVQDPETHTYPQQNVAINNTFAKDRLKK